MQSQLMCRGGVNRAASAPATVTHTANLAKAFVGLFGNQAAFGEAYQISSDECHTWNRIAQMVCDALGWEPRLSYVPAHDLGFELGGDFGRS